MVITRLIKDASRNKNDMFGEYFLLLIEHLLNFPFKELEENKGF